MIPLSRRADAIPLEAPKGPALADLRELAQQLDRHRYRLARPPTERATLAPALVFRSQQASRARLVACAGDQPPGARSRPACDSDLDPSVGGDVADPVRTFPAAGEEEHRRGALLGAEPQLDDAPPTRDTPDRLEIAVVLVDLVLGEDRGRARLRWRFQRWTP